MRVLLALTVILLAFHWIDGNAGIESSTSDVDSVIPSGALAELGWAGLEQTTAVKAATRQKIDPGYGKDFPRPFDVKRLKNDIGITGKQAQKLAFFLERSKQEALNTIGHCISCMAVRSELCDAKLISKCAQFGFGHNFFVS